MVCPECGATNDADATECAYCAADLSVTSSSSPGPIEHDGTLAVVLTDANNRVDAAEAESDADGAFTHFRSALLVDQGHAFVKLAVADIVENEYRVLAAERIAAPADGVTQAIAPLLAGIRRLEQTTGRSLLEHDRVIAPERQDGGGVDTIVATSSCTAPLRAVIVHADPTPTTQLLAALESVPVNLLAIQGGRPVTAEDQEDWMGRQIDTVVNFNPTVCILNAEQAGKDDCGSAIGVVAGVVLTNPERAMPLVCVGSDETLEILRGSLGDLCDFHAVILSSKNPTQHLVRLHQTILEIREHATIDDPATAPLTALGIDETHDSQRGFESIVAFMHEQYGMNVAVADAGASSASLFASLSREAPRVASSHHLGLGRNLEMVLTNAGWANVSRWLPFDMSEDEALNLVGNHALRPNLVPADVKELALLQALTREALRLVSGGDLSEFFGTGERFDLVVGAGLPFAAAGSYGQAALMLLDIVQPRFLSTLTIDPLGVLPQLGVLSRSRGTAPAQILEHDALLRLGTCIAPTGMPKDGAPAVRVVIEFADGTTTSSEVNQGTIEVAPLRVGQRASLRLYPTRHCDVGLGKGANAKSDEIEGGLVGLIIDARGRPLTLAPTREKRQAKLLEWMQALGAYQSYAFQRALTPA